MAAKAVAQDASMLDFTDARSEAILIEVVRSDGMKLGTLVRHPACTEAVVHEALRQNGEALRCVPADLRTSDFVSIVVTSSPSALLHTPRALMTADLIQVALQKDGCSFAWLP